MRSSDHDAGLLHALFDAYDEWRAAHLPLTSGAESRLIDAITTLRAATTDPTPHPHTRTSTPEGPDFCAECSAAAAEWVKWPCPAAVLTDGVE
jgi:hypothetical protein